MRTAQEETLTSVISAARATNGWQVRGLAMLPEEGTGIILFRHRVPQAEDSFGTAHFDAKGEVPSFFWGHYDMSERAALDDFTDRLKIGR